MRQLHILLLDHGVVHGGINFLVTEELLHLLDRHSFAYHRSCQYSSELMRMHLR